MATGARTTFTDANVGTPANGKLGSYELYEIIKNIILEEFVYN